MNYKFASRSELILIFSVVLVVFSLQSCLSTKYRSNKNLELSEWKIVKEDNSDKRSWSIYSRKITGTTSLEYKIEGIINSTPKVCLAAFKQNIHHQADESMKKKYPIYDITEVTKKGLLTYVIHNEPFPLKDTEMRIRYLFYNKKDGSTAVNWQEAWEDSPIQTTKKLKRIETFRGSWNFTPIVRDSCKGTKTVQFDPKKMPKWLFEPMVIKFLKEEMKEIKGIVSTSNEKITS